MESGRLPRHVRESADRDVRTPSPRYPSRGGRRACQRPPRANSEQSQEPGQNRDRITGNKTRKTAMNSVEKRRLYREKPMEHLIRDEGVAGSNPATPTNKIRHFSHFAIRRCSHWRQIGDRLTPPGNLPGPRKCIDCLLLMIRRMVTVNAFK